MICIWIPHEVLRSCSAPNVDLWLSFWLVNSHLRRLYCSSRVTHLISPNVVNGFHTEVQFKPRMLHGSHAKDKFALIPHSFILASITAYHRTSS